VNKVAAADPSSSEDAVDSVRLAERVDFTVLRGGTSLSFSVLGRE